MTLMLAWIGNVSSPTVMTPSPPIKVRTSSTPCVCSGTSSSGAWLDTHTETCDEPASRLTTIDNEGWPDAELITGRSRWYTTGMSHLRQLAAGTSSAPHSAE